ncbi:alpha/beta hydrolase (plasmid) [Photobacterium sp. DA100]|uniref:alpha/beta fold hydrolase n=1 Tax=Photobacterium sp. DA100 TaxID=3027472 RepID=UPI00247AFB09|nr:alpha/beta hydrolase [Photobacterium sp. DA100]WEM45545.1 alpha/beta hydrolase [Photobacterium sp. DA100]
MNRITTDPNRPILLIRGLLRETRHWGKFLVMLKATFPKREIITLDIAGNGPRYREQSATSVSEMVDDLRCQLSAYQSHTNRSAETLSAEDGVDIIAISLGGMIALEWMRKFPQEIHSAILINSSLGNYSPFYKRLKWQQYKNIVRYFFISEQKREALIFAMTTRQSPPSIINNWIKWRVACPISASNALRQLYAASRYQYAVVPTAITLLIGSKQDALVDISCSKALAKAWNIPLLLHPEAGHDLPTDDPDWLIDKIQLYYQRQAVPDKEYECEMN